MRFKIQYSRDSTQPTMAAPAQIVGWVKRDTGTIFVGFAYLIVPQQSEIAIKLANPTQSLQTIGLTQPTSYQITSTNLEPEIKGSFVISLAPALNAVPAIIRSCNSGMSSISKAFSIISSVIGSTAIDSYLLQ